jgi:hypothetical protein
MGSTSQVGSLVGICRCSVDAIGRSLVAKRQIWYQLQCNRGGTLLQLPAKMRLLDDFVLYGYSALHAFRLHDLR